MSDIATRPRVDPRIVRRWVEVRRANGRRRLRVLIAIASFLVLVLAAAGSLYSPLFNVRHIRVSVVGPASSATVVALSGVSHHDLMIDVDPARVAGRLSATPDLGGVRVVREWPGTVKIAVYVRHPVAQVALGSGASGPRDWAMIDNTGRVLADLAKPTLGLPVMQGFPAAPAPGKWLPGSLGPSVVPGTAADAEVDMGAAPDTVQVPQGAAAALAALAAIPGSFAPDVMSVAIDGSGQLSMTVLPARVAAGSIQVKFGDGSELAQKITSLITLLSQANLSGVTEIDLTVPSRPAALTGG